MSKPLELSDEKMSAEAEVIRLQAKYNGRAVISLGRDLDLEIKRVPTASCQLNWATGGGIPRGRLTQFSGEESASKTTNALHVCASAIAAGGRAFWGTTEDFDWAYAAHCGIPIGTKQFALCQSQEGNYLLDSVIDAIRSGTWSVWVIDSIAALRNWEYLLDDKGEVRKSTGEMGRGGEAKMIGEFVARMFDSYRKNTVSQTGFDFAFREVKALHAKKSKLAADNKKFVKRDVDRLAALKTMLDKKWGGQRPIVAAGIAINQLRDAGVDGSNRGGSSTYNPGGRGLRHGKSLDIEFRTVEKLFATVKKDDQNKMQGFTKAAAKDPTFVPLIAKRIGFVITKSKICTPFRYGSYYLGASDHDPFRTGQVYQGEEVLNFGRRWGVISLSGSFYKIGDHSLGQGEMKAAKNLQANPELMAKVLEESLKRAPA